MSLIIGVVFLNFYFVCYGVSKPYYITEWFGEFWNEPVSIDKFIHEIMIFKRGYPSKEYVIPS